MASVRDVFARGAYIMQRDLPTSRRASPATWGKHVFGVADGTMGLLLPLLAQAANRATRSSSRRTPSLLRPPPFTMRAAHRCLRTAAGPSHRPRLGSTDHGPRTRGIMPVQLNGRTADMDRYRRDRARHGLFIVEDSCQALGSKWQGPLRRNFRLCGSISFYPSKTLGAFRRRRRHRYQRRRACRRLRISRDHGRGHDGTRGHVGLQLRASTTCRPRSCIKLKRLRCLDRPASHLARHLRRAAKGLDAAAVAAGPDAGADHFDIFQNYEIEAERRDESAQYLEANGVAPSCNGAGTHAPVPGLGSARPLPVHREDDPRFMLLPMNTSLSGRRHPLHLRCDRGVLPAEAIHDRNGKITVSGGSRTEAESWKRPVIAPASNAIPLLGNEAREFSEVCAPPEPDAVPGAVRDFQARARRERARWSNAEFTRVRHHDLGKVSAILEPVNLTRRIYGFDTFAGFPM